MCVITTNEGSKGVVSMFYSPLENTANELEKLKESMDKERLFFPEDVTCTCCKTRLSDFLETGYVGCVECYKLFKQDITNMLYNFHKSVKHMGKRPEGVVTKAKKQREIDLLLKQKADAVENDDFITAQMLKEKIEKLRSEL